MSNNTSPKSCVIADDVRASRETVGTWLRECGFECRLAENGQHAWDLVRERTPDLIVTDLEMPILCGLELLQRIRDADDPAICEVPVLVMTSLRDGKTLNIVQKMGGDGLLQKPLDKLATFSVILDLVAGRQNLPGMTHTHDETRVHGEGVISPTLRRLLKTVAKNELS